MIRLAIIGAGQISHRYLKQAAVSDRTQCIAICSRTISNAENIASEYKIASVFDDTVTMLDTVKPDAVVVATPTAFHAQHTIEALQRGIHVLCEKPMAATYHECEAMALAAATNALTLLCLPYDASPALLAALPYVNTDTLGVFTGAEAQLLLPGVSRDNWYYDLAVAGGGAGLDTLVYPVSQLVRMLGPAKKVTGFANTLIPQRILGPGETIDVAPPPADPRLGKVVRPNVDDNTALIIEWENGQQAIVRALWATSFVQSYATIYGRRATLWLCGNDVVLHSPDGPIPGGTPIAWRGLSDCWKIPVQPISDVSQEGLLEHFVDCIEGYTDSTCELARQLHVHEILFAGYEAGKDGIARELTTTFQSPTHIDTRFLDTCSTPL